MAALLKASTKTVMRRISEGELHAHRLGRMWRVSEEDLQAYMNKYRR